MFSRVASDRIGDFGPAGVHTEFMLQGQSPGQEALTVCGAGRVSKLWMESSSPVPFFFWVTRGRFGFRGSERTTQAWWHNFLTPNGLVKLEFERLANAHVSPQRKHRFLSLPLAYPVGGSD